MTAPGRVDVVIVNWNAGDLLAACLGSLAKVSDGHEIARVVVVDNGSTDGSADIAIPALPLDIVKAGKNLGFGRACNLGAARGTAEYILFLNPDTEIAIDTIGRTAAYLDMPEQREIGVVGIRLDDRAGNAQRHCARFPSARTFVAESLGLTHLLPRWFQSVVMRDFDHLETRDVDHVMGAFYLIRRSLFDGLGGFDDDYFVYFEDLDLSRRVRDQGKRIRYLAEPRAYHRQGGTSEQIKARRLYYSLAGRLTYAAKHFGVSGLVAVWATTLVVEPATRLVFAAARRSIAEIAATWQGMGMLYRSLPARLGDKGDRR